MTGQLTGGSIRILWDADDSAEVTITGGVSSWTVNGSAVTFPYTLSSSTTFETAHSGTYTVSVQHHGHEVANTPDGTREVELRFGEQAAFEPTVDDTGGGQWMADLHRELSATYGPALPVATVTRDATGRVSSITENGVTETYTRDSLGRVATITRDGTTRTVVRTATGAFGGLS